MFVNSFHKFLLKDLVRMLCVLMPPPPIKGEGCIAPEGRFIMCAFIGGGRVLS